jgi:hypothetical protein
MIHGGGDVRGFAAAQRADFELALAHWVLKSYASPAGSAARPTADLEAASLAASPPRAPRAQRGPRAGGDRRVSPRTGGGDSAGRRAGGR